MQDFVLTGKANVIFRLVELMAKGEKAEKAGKKENKK